MKAYVKRLKKLSYFMFAHYFSCLSKVILYRWKPRILVITGSVGKTTLMHLVEAQIGDKAIYSHKANSAYGIPLHLLDILPKSNGRLEQVKLILLAPFKIFRSIPKQKIYIVEADSDRPGEGKFLGKLLKPEVVIWTTTDRTHSWNFTNYKKWGFPTIEAAISHSFGELVQRATKRVVLLDPNKLMKESVSNSTAEVTELTSSQISEYAVTKDSTHFTYVNRQYVLPVVVPSEVTLSAAASIWITKYLDLPANDQSFSQLVLPPGRSSIFKGIKNTTLLDSSYNTDMLSIKIMLQLLKSYPGTTKWAVIGDMTEKGSVEAEEHVKLASLLEKEPIDQLILYGRRTKKYTLPELQNSTIKSVVSFENPAEVITFLQDNLKGGEVILFKGAGFLEGVVERFLDNPKDAALLCRRELIWQKRRAQWGL